MRIPAFVYRWIAALLGIVYIGSARASLDFGSIGAGLQQILTIPVTGAKVGDYVFIGVGDALEAGLALGQAIVMAADTVSVTLANNTAGAIDPAAHTFTVTVLRRTL